MSSTSFSTPSVATVTSLERDTRARPHAAPRRRAASRRTPTRRAPRRDRSRTASGQRRERAASHATSSSMTARRSSGRNGFRTKRSAPASNASSRASPQALMTTTELRHPRRSELGEHVEAADPGHHQVEHDHVGRSPCDLECFVAVRGLDEPEAGTQGHANQLAQGSLVFANQNRALGAHRLVSPRLLRPCPWSPGQRRMAAKPGGRSVREPSLDATFPPPAGMIGRCSRCPETSGSRGWSSSASAVRSRTLGNSSSSYEGTSPTTHKSRCRRHGSMTASAWRRKLLSTTRPRSPASSPTTSARRPPRPRSTYRTLGRDADSDRVLREGIERFPDFKALRAFHAMTLYNLGRPRDAVEQLLELLVETANDPSIERYSACAERVCRRPSTAAVSGRDDASSSRPRMPTFPGVGSRRLGRPNERRRRTVLPAAVRGTGSPDHNRVMSPAFTACSGGRIGRKPRWEAGAPEWDTEEMIMGRSSPTCRAVRGC